ncbi:hypothetical protein FPV67DRAFT_1444489 [Lyophyllum atratum]|nr:hypothetical protein FPV67DRAFT_1444489 [Lyophyllum atratum]
MTPRGLCHQFASTRTCNYKDRCRFSHALDSGFTAQGSVKAPKAGTCRQFAWSGTCRYGTLCKFSHISRSGSGSQAPAKPLAPRLTSENPLDEFFKSYSETGFTYNANQPVWKEFYRMVDDLGWDDEEKDEEREAFKDALVQAFNSTYGTDENDLESWQSLCLVLNIVPIPEELRSCREAVKGTYVNLVDLVDNRKSGRAVERFESEEALSAYTLRSGNYFPKENAYAGGLLKYLLRNILHPNTQRHPHLRKKR